jgi:hypothetical protein
VLLTKSDDVEKAVACGVAKEAEVAIEAPTSGGVTEVVERDVGVLELRTPNVLGNGNSSIPKADDVAPSGLNSNRGEIADVPVDAPARIVGEIVDSLPGGLSELVIATVGGEQDVILPKSNQVVGAVASDVADETDVFIDAPPSCIVTEVSDHWTRLKNDIDVAKPDHDPILTKAKDGRKAWARGGNWERLCQYGHPLDFGVLTRAFLGVDLRGHFWTS